MRKSKLLSILIALSVVLLLYIVTTKQQSKLGIYNTTSKVKYDQPDMYVQIHNKIRQGSKELFPTYDKNNAIHELQKAKKNQRKSVAKSITWQERGPANVPGRTRAVIVDPDDPTGNTWIAGAASGGIWKTLDGGSNWEYISNGFPNLSISSLVCCESSPNVIYAGTGERGLSGVSAVNGGGILKSIDKGQTWKLLENTIGDDVRTINRLLADPENPNIILACVVSVNYHPINNDNDSITTAILKSVDGGQTWSTKYHQEITFTDTGMVQQLIADPGNFEIQYASVMGKGVLKSVDGGETWNLYTDGFENEFERIELAIAHNNTNILYASVDGNALGNNSDFYVSQDAGESWQLVQEMNGESSPNWLSSQGWYDNTILVNPYHDSIVYVGGINLWKINVYHLNSSETVEKSTAHMTDSYFEIDGKNYNVHVDQHNLTAILGESDEFRILNGNDGGLFLSNMSDDPGFAPNTWTAVAIGYNTSQFYGADKLHESEMYIGGTQDNGSWMNMEPGPDETTEYSQVIGGDGFEAIYHYENPSYIMVSSQYNGFVHTLDGGETGHDAATGLEGEGPFITRIGYSRSDPDLLWAVTSQGVGKSDNFALQWQMTYIEDEKWNFWNGIDVEVSKANPQIVMAGGSMSEDGSLFISTDGGLSFEPTVNFKDIGYSTGLASHPFEDSTFFVLFSVNNESKILRTTDLGQNWEDLSGFDNSSSSNGFPNTAVYDILVMPFDPNVLWAGTEIGIFESVDDGQTWNLLDSDLPNVSVWEMKIVDDQVVIATFGRGIWTATIPELEGYEYPDVVRVPRINNLYQQISTKSPSIKAEIELRDVYDSTQIFLNDDYVQTLQANCEVETIDQTIYSDFAGEITMDLVAWYNGMAYKSVSVSTFIVDLNNAVEEYQNDFNNDSDDFTGYGFYVALVDGFSDQAIHSPHFYGPDNTFINMLKYPVILSKESTMVTYKDVAIVEPGDPGTSYGDESFWDYVVVEGSKDGHTWVEFEDGYDASYNNTWLDAYGNSSPGTESMYVEHELELHNTFETGDTILIRFRLYSDQSVTAWGWAIDDLAIGNFDVGVHPEIISSDKLKLYPNPNNGVFKIETGDVFSGQVFVSVYNTKGSCVYEHSFITHSKSKVKVDIRNQPAGYYIVRMHDKTTQISKKVKIGY